jgi:hypothetical protein
MESIHGDSVRRISGAEKSTAAAGAMLEGQALLEKARSLSNRPEDQIARACGYVGPSGRILKKSFYRALVLAKGYKLPAGVATSAGSKGRQAEFRTRVHGNGNLLIGQAYTRRMGLEPGQEFRIELHHETGSIWLMPMDGSEAPAGTPSSGAEAAASDVHGDDATSPSF